MYAERVEKIEWVLRLNEEEKEWLKGLVQNPMCENEMEFDREMRSKIWESLGGRE